VTMERRWSDDDILYAILEWHEEHGCPPSWDDWSRSGGDKHPTSVTVLKRFGSLGTAIREAGLTPYEPQRVKFDEALAHQLRMDGVPDTEISKRLGIGYHVLFHRLGPRPKPVKTGKRRSREQRIADLQEALKKGER